MQNIASRDKDIRAELTGRGKKRKDRDAAMDVMEALLTRRSIRKYLPAPLDDGVVTQLLRAAMAAPTATAQAYDFIVVQDRAVLSQIRSFHPHAEMLAQAPVGIVICGDPTREALPGRWIMDCSAAAENILLAAHGLGLGACWVGIYPVEERINGVRRLFGIPAHVTPLCVVAVGHPGEKKAPPDRFKVELIHREKW
ncbi:MAG: nitroreductase family protein [Desulfomonilaceae bacterium]